MKKRFLAALIFACAFTMSVSACGASFKPSGGDTDITDNEQIRAIYLKAVEAGYEGTYEEWLETIRGKDGTTILFDSKDPESDVGKIGDFYLNINTWDLFVKTEVGWTKVGNILGKDGKDGDTPYIGENGNWWIGDHDTGIHAQGSQGNPGENGETPYIGQNGNWWIGQTDTGVHAQGEQGTPGENGETPYIGENGNWWIGDHDTGIHAQGEQGTPGENGLTPYIGENGNWWIGDQDTGVHAQGSQGNPGENGETPYIGQNGNWWIGDHDTGVHAQGSQGNPGQDGQNGQNGLTPYIGQNGNWWIGDTDTGVHAQGQQGNPGQNGQDGQPGQTAWSNTILPSFYGYVDVNVGSALEGQKVVFTAYREHGYDLVDIYLNGESYIDQYDRNTCTLTVEMVKNGYVVRPIFQEVYYDVYFINSFGDYLDCQYVRIDDYPYYEPEQIIYRDGSEYEFVGWDKNFYPVSSSTTYTAIYSERIPATEKYGTVHLGDEDDPFDNEDAILVAKNLRDEDRNRYFYISGTIERFYNGPENRTDGACSWFLTPAEEGGEQFEIYRCYPYEGLDGGFTWENIGVGDYTKVRATLTVYNGVQPETASVELVNIDCNHDSTWMEIHESSVAEALQYGLTLRDCENSPYQLGITAYVVDYDRNFYYIADEASADSNLQRLAIRRNGGIEFNKFDKITVTDYVRNYHGAVEFNAYYISNRVSVIESGEPWNDCPQKVELYYNGSYVDPYSNFELQVGTSIYFDMVFDIENFSELDSLRITTGSNASASIVDGKLCLTGIREGTANTNIYNKNNVRIARLYIDVVPYVDPLEGISVSEVNEEKVVEAQYSSEVVLTLSPIPSTSKFSNINVTISDEEMLYYSWNESNNIFHFYGRGKAGDVTVTFTDSKSGISETVTVRLIKVKQEFAYIVDNFENALHTMFGDEIQFSVNGNYSMGGANIDETYEEMDFADAAALIVPESMSPYCEVGSMPYFDGILRWQYFINDNHLLMVAAFCSVKEKMSMYQIQWCDAEMTSELDNFTYANPITDLCVGDYAALYIQGNFSFPAGSMTFTITDPAVIEYIPYRGVRALNEGKSSLTITYADGRTQTFDFTVTERTGTVTFYFTGISEWENANVYFGVNGDFTEMNRDGAGNYYITVEANEVHNTFGLYIEQDGKYFHPYSGTEDYDTMYSTIEFSYERLSFNGVYTIKFEDWAYNYENWEHAWFNYTVSEGKPNDNSDLSYFVEAVQSILKGRGIECEISLDNIEDYIIEDKIYVYSLQEYFDSELSIKAIAEEYTQYLPRCWEIENIYEEGTFIELYYKCTDADCHLRIQVYHGEEADSYYAIFISK